MHRYAIGLGFSLATFLVGCSGAIAPDPNAGSGSQAVNGGATKDGATSGDTTAPSTADPTGKGGTDTPAPTTGDPGDKGGKGGTTSGTGDPKGGTEPTTGDPGDKGGKGGTTGAPPNDPTCVSITLPGCSSVVDAKMISVAKCAGMSLVAFTTGPSCGDTSALDIAFTCCAPATTTPPTKPGDPPNKGCGDVPPPSDPNAPPTKGTGSVPPSTDPPDGASKK